MARCLDSLSQLAQLAFVLAALLLAYQPRFFGERMPPHFIMDLGREDEALRQFVRRTLTDISRVKLWEASGSRPLWFEARRLDLPVEGLVLDLGVFLGDSTRTIAKFLGNSTMVHGVDTFTGIPEVTAWNEERWPVGMLSLEEGWVRRLARLDNLSIVDGMPPTLGFNVTFHRGLTYDVLPRLLQAHPGDSVAFLHLDLDTYEGTYHALETLRRRLRLGSTLVFDDLLVLNAQFRALFEFWSKYRFRYTVTSWGCHCLMANSSKRVRRQQYADQLMKDPWRLVLGLVHYPSWADYRYTLGLRCEPTAVGMRITGLGHLQME